MKSDDYVRGNATMAPTTIVCFPSESKTTSRSRLTRRETHLVEIVHFGINISGSRLFDYRIHIKVELLADRDAIVNRLVTNNGDTVEERSGGVRLLGCEIASIEKLLQFEGFDHKLWISDGCLRLSVSRRGRYTIYGKLGWSFGFDADCQRIRRSHQHIGDAKNLIEKLFCTPTGLVMEGAQVRISSNCSVDQFVEPIHDQVEGSN